MFYRFSFNTRSSRKAHPIFAPDERARVDFETDVMNRFFELKSYLDEYQQLFRLRIMGGTE